MSRKSHIFQTEGCIRQEEEPESGLGTYKAVCSSFAVTSNSNLRLSSSERIRRFIREISRIAGFRNTSGLVKV